MQNANYDVVICGGGKAGLCVARQLRRALPDASIAVVERSTRPLPVACHKVGESSVELATHYFRDVLGLADYLEETHLHKNGLRFFTDGGATPLVERPEIGPAEFPIVPSFQIDRGRFETDMRGFIEEAGVDLLEDVSVRELEIGAEDELHRVTLSDGRTLSGRWLVDASGRARLISKRLDLRRPSPNQASAAWFRIEGQLRVADLVEKSERGWHARDVDGNRWQSTIHLMGQGYWVWIIVLATGHTSIGIVADHEHHDFTSYNREERANEWLEKHEPQLAAYLKDKPREDFRVVHNYSYLSERVLDSKRRWACVGEAALFVDPLYSLGGDFLSMSNTYATRIIREDLEGVSDAERHPVAEALNETMLLLAHDAARTLSTNGKVFPHSDILGAKLWWDFFNYWSFMCAHFFQRIYSTDAETLRAFLQMGKQYYALNTEAQTILETWGALKSEPGAKKAFVPLPMFPSVLAKQHLALLEKLDPAATLQKMTDDLETGRELVTEVLAHALRDLGPGQSAQLRAKLGGIAPLDARASQRFADDALPRRERVERLPEIGRDLERALGRKNAKVALSTLWDPPPRA